MQKKKKICAVNGEGPVTDRTCEKWFVKFRAGDFSLAHAPQSGRPGDSDPIETLRTINVLSPGRQPTTENIQINQVTDENVKCIFYFTEKSKWTFWPTEYVPNVSPVRSSEPMLVWGWGRQIPG